MWFPSFLRRRSAERTPRPARRKAPATRLAVEALEDRLALSAAGASHDWAMFNHNPEGTRHNAAETQLSRSNVGGLHEQWRFPTAGVISSTPVVVNDVVYAVDSTGTVYSLNRDGSLRWSTTVDVPTVLGIKVGAGLTVTRGAVVFGDLAGYIHGLDADTGTPLWDINPNPHTFGAIFGAGTVVGDKVAIGTSSYELLVPALNPAYTTFTFRGSVVLLDPVTGAIQWQTFTVPEPAAGTIGGSGATVWGSPAYDKATKTIYVGTGNNYSEPTTNTSDALMALNAKTGAVKWVSQKTADDSWNFSYLPEDPDDPPDFDFGDSPQIYKLGGRTVVAAGQKSGFFHVVDAATGAEIKSPVQYLPGDHLGGFHIDSAFADGVNYAPGNYWHDPFSGGAPHGGALFAIKDNGARELWHFDTVAPIISGVAVANGVVYFQTLDGTFHALHSRSGKPLAELNTGGQSSGPAISRGRIYLGTGDAMSTVFNPLAPPAEGGYIISLGIDERRGSQSRPLTGQGSGSFIDDVGGFFATGIMSHLGEFTHYGTLVLTATADPTVFAISGDVTYEADNGDKLYGSVSGTLNARTGEVSATDTWTGGTGRFADASGTALVTGLITGATFTFELVGDLGY